MMVLIYRNSKNFGDFLGAKKFFLDYKIMKLKKDPKVYRALEIK